MTRNYKALSVVEPWGDFIARGKKTIEVRSWIPENLAPDEDLLIVQNKRRLEVEGDTDPEGRAMALVRVVEVRPFRPEDRPEAKTELYLEGYHAWILADIRPVLGKVRVPAQRKIYHLCLDEISLGPPLES